MKEKILGYLVALLVRTLTPELVKELLQKVLDWTKEKVLGTASEVDDDIVLPIIKIIEDTIA